MHRSRLCAVVVDCEDADLDAAARFWTEALGRREVEREGSYVTLEDRASQPLVLLQRVDHPSRVHLDIESDDVEAEVRRLEALGAKRVAQVRTWWVLEAPTGQRFCVVRPQRGTLGPDANTWP
jgi:catechol 2,3-dioxygenase-like lactoylglutathione lyase family enzyme